MNYEEQRVAGREDDSAHFVYQVRAVPPLQIAYPSLAMPLQVVHDDALWFGFQWNGMNCMHGVP